MVQGNYKNTINNNYLYNISANMSAFVTLL